MLPKQIKPCPIHEAVVEIKFETTIPPEVIIGYVYPELQNEYGKPKGLPILNLPHIARKNDPNLKYVSWYRMEKKPYVVHIGPNVLLFSCIRGYTTWEDFSKEMNAFYEKMFKKLNFTRIFRVGIRYINIFSNKNIFDGITLKIQNNEEWLSQKNFTDQTYTTKIVGTECATKLEIQHNSIKKESKIDIDTFKIVENEMNINEFLQLVGNLHEEEKNVFYSLIDKEFLKKNFEVYYE